MLGRRKSYVVVDGLRVPFVSLDSYRQRLTNFVGSGGYASIYINGHPDYVFVEGPDRTRAYMNPRDLSQIISVSLTAVGIAHTARQLRGLVSSANRILGSVIIKKAPGQQAVVETRPLLRGI